jgi:hypothetical protein
MTTDDPVIRVTSDQHSGALVASLNILLHDEILLDCSLLCDGRMIKAHRVILSASCAYFRAAFTSFPSATSCQNTAIILSDIPFSDLKTIIDFIYEGDISIEVTRVPSLLKSAQSLQVKSLCAKLSSIASDAGISSAITSLTASSAACINSNDSLPNSSLQNLQHVTRDTILCEALTGLRSEAVRDNYDRNDLEQNNSSLQERTSPPPKMDDQYSSSEEIDIPAVGTITALIPNGISVSEEDEDNLNDRLPVDLSSNASISGSRRYHVKPRDLYANGILSRHTRTGSFTMGQSLDDEYGMRPQSHSVNDSGHFWNSNHALESSGDAAADQVGVRSDSLSSGENLTLKRGRGRPPRHSLDDELRSGENRATNEMVPEQLMDEVLGYKRVKLNSLGVPASVRGRKPKLSYSGSQREISVKNKCPYCPQVYYSTQAMNDHISNVHSKNSLKYGCKFCSKEFSWKISLNKHLRKQHPETNSKNAVPTLCHS